MFTRRNFLRSTALASAATVLEPAWSRTLAAEAPPVLKSISVDIHNHIIFPGQTQSSPDTALPFRKALELTGLTAVCASWGLDQPRNQKPGEAYAKILDWLKRIDSGLKESGMHRALTLADLESAKASGTPTIIQSVEGAMFLEGNLARVEEVYGRGLRHLQLLHEQDDLVKPLGDVNITPDHLGGLTAFGAQVIRECNRLGIVVDVAHASHETIVGALKVSTTPIIFSHTNLSTWTGKDMQKFASMKPRLISKEDAKLIADAGGMVGVWTHLTATMEEYVESIKVMVDAIGVDHVAIGTDSELLNPKVIAGTTSAYPNLHAGFSPSVTEEMQRQGFSSQDVEKIGGGNFCRLFGQVTSKRQR